MKKQKRKPAALRNETPEASPKTIVETKTLIPEERIRQRAYEIHKVRGGGSGRELDDWLQAERELMAELEQPAGSGGKADAAGHRGSILPASKN